MIRVKDIIARRRPPLSGEEAVDAAPVLPEEPAKVIAPEASQPHHGKDESDLINARRGRDAKPWRLPEPDWSPEGGGHTAKEEMAPPPTMGPAPSVKVEKRNIWELETPEEASSRSEPVARVEPAPAPQPVSPRPDVLKTPAAARNKTRLLGFHGDGLAKDVFAGATPQAPTAAPRYPVGWLVVVEGPGRGASFTLLPGLSTIGRASDQTVSLDYGDASISRNNHASIAYDDEDGIVYVGHGGKSNIVRLNGKPLLSNEALEDGDMLRIGKTTLRYVAFCGPGFRWNEVEDDAAGDAVE